MNNLAYDNGCSRDDKCSNNPLSLPSSEAEYESRLAPIDQKSYIDAVEADRYYRAKKLRPQPQNEDREYVVFPEPIAIPIQAYIAFEQTTGLFTQPNRNLPRMRQDSEGSEVSSLTDSRRSSIYENGYWRPPISIPKDFAGNAEISYAEEAINALDDDLSSVDVEGDTYPTGPTFRSKSVSFISNTLMTKLPKRSWFCDRCRKPRDECQCLCAIS